MIQRQRTHPKGTFLVCQACHLEPRHFVIGGGIHQSGQGTETHLLECRCHATTKFPDLEKATRSWNDIYAVRPAGRQVLHLTRSAGK